MELPSDLCDSLLVRFEVERQSSESVSTQMFFNVSQVTSEVAVRMPTTEETSRIYRSSNVPAVWKLVP